MGVMPVEGCDMGTVACIHPWAASQCLLPVSLSIMIQSRGSYNYNTNTQTVATHINKVRLGPDPHQVQYLPEDKDNRFPLAVTTGPWLAHLRHRGH